MGYGGGTCDNQHIFESGCEAAVPAGGLILRGVQVVVGVPLEVQVEEGKRERTAMRRLVEVVRSSKWMWKRA